jgi:hypothetical protein
MGLSMGKGARSLKVATLVAFFLCAGLCCAGLNCAVAVAADKDAELLVSELTLGHSRFVLRAESSHIPDDGHFSYTVTVRPDAQLQRVALKFQILRGNGSLIFKRSHELTLPKVDEGNGEAGVGSGAGAGAGSGASGAGGAGGGTNAGSGSGGNANRGATTTQNQLKNLSSTFERNEPNLNGLGMTEGIYRVECTVTAYYADGDQEAVLKDLLVVYNPNVPAPAILPVLRMSAPPGRDSEGIFLENPASETSGGSRRVQIERLCGWLRDTGTEGTRRHLTLAISPLLLEEWADAADGYRYRTEGGETLEVAADAAGALSYARTLADIRAAVAGGRLTLTQQGYADPDFSSLRSAGLAKDLQEHYRLGAEVLADILSPGIDAGSAESVDSTITTTLTAPPRGFACAADVLDLADLADSETSSSPAPRTLLLDTSTLVGKKRPVAADVGRGMTGLFADASLGKAVLQPEHSAALRTFLESRSNDRAAAVIAVSYPENPADMNVLTSQIMALADYPWLRLTDSADSAFDPGKTQARLVNTPTTAGDNAATDDVDADADSAGVNVGSPAGMNGAAGATITGTDTDTGTTTGTGADTAADGSALGWDHVVLARQSAEGLSAALTSGGTEAEAAGTAPAEAADAAADAATVDEAVLSDLAFVARASLTAEASSGTAAAGTALANSQPEEVSAAALSLADAATARARGYFDQVHLELSSLTLSGSTGKLPITVINDGDTPLNLRLELTGAEGVKVTPAVSQLDVPANETFVEPSLELRNIISGNLRARLVSGPMVVAEKQIRVSATYIDKIGIIVVVAIAGTVLAAYAWRRSRRPAVALTGNGTTAKADPNNGPDVTDTAATSAAAATTTATATAAMPTATTTKEGESD